MHSYVIADVFTSRHLEGNPLAVFLDGSDIPAERMQRIAREMNLSETTFVLPAEGAGDVRVRIFTPVNELPFAGHPTLGTAIVLGESMPLERIRMETGIGIVPFDLNRVDRRVISARMWQPIPSWAPYEYSEALLAALGVLSSTLPIEIYRNGPRHVYIGLSSVDALSAIVPDHRALGEFPDLAVNCFAPSGSRWRMRMFSPAYGVVEDAATGSAAGPLAVHLIRHGLADFGQLVEIVQGVECGRPSTMHAKVTGTPDRIDTIEVSGSAVVTGRGTLLI